MYNVLLYASKMQEGVYVCIYIIILDLMNNSVGHMGPMAMACIFSGFKDHPQFQCFAIRAQQYSAKHLFSWL